MSDLPVELTPAQLRALRPGQLVTLTAHGYFLSHCSATGQRAEVVKVGRLLVHVRSQTSGVFKIRIDDPTPRKFGLAAGPDAPPLGCSMASPSNPPCTVEMTTGQAELIARALELFLDKAVGLLPAEREEAAALVDMARETDPDCINGWCL